MPKTMCKFHSKLYTHYKGQMTRVMRKWVLCHMRPKLVHPTCPTAQSGQVLRWLIYKVKPWFVVSYPNSVAPVRNFHRKRRHRDGRSNFADARYMLYIIARCVFSCLKLVSPISVLLCSLLLLLTRTSTDTNMNFILICLFNARKTHCIFRLLLIKQSRVFNICFRHINCYSRFYALYCTKYR